METLTPEQVAARAVGMSHGVPEEFAIDCKAIALGNITMGKNEYKSGDKDVRLYDSRTRDRLRAKRKIIVTDDVFLLTKYPAPATISSVSTVNTEDDHGTQSSTTGDEGGEGSTLTLHEYSSEEARTAPSKARRSRRGRSGPSS